MKGRFIPPRRKEPGTMNKLEEKYSRALDIWIKEGTILGYKYEAVKFKLADKTFYTPDFMVVYPDKIAFHETKGFMRDDANVKLKVVASLFPEFEFVLVQWIGGKVREGIPGKWDFREI